MKINEILNNHVLISFRLIFTIIILQLHHDVYFLKLELVVLTQ